MRHTSYDVTYEMDGDKDEQEALPDIPVSVTCEDISDLPRLRKLTCESSGFSSGFIRIHPYNQVYPKHMKNYLNDISNFEVREDDVWVTSFPKSGTTWTQEMVWCIKNKVDIERATATKLEERVPFFEHSALAHTVPDKNSLEDVDKLPSPRIIKTHLSFEMLPKQCREKDIPIVYVTRNPRDVSVSMYNHFKVLRGYTGTFEDVAQLFLDDICGFCTPFIHHVLSYWKQCHMPNILFITFEEMKSNLPSVIRKVAAFLGEELTDEDVTILENHLSFENMKRNPAVNKQELIRKVNNNMEQKVDINDAPEKLEFIRKGKVGNWKDYFSDELLEKFVEWETKGLVGSTLRFVYE